MKAKIDFTKRNQKVASNRGDDWTKNLKLGKLEARLKPTKLQIIRIEKNLNQTQVASKFKMSLSTYGAIERGKRRVTESTANQLSKFFNAPKQQLFVSVSKGKFVATY